MRAGRTNTVAHGIRSAGNTRFVAGWVLFAIGIWGCDGACAHGGVDNTLYVAETGIDRDRCLHKATPCGTIGYALAVAGKGSRVEIAPGTYPIDDAEELFHIVSGMIDVVGGVPFDDPSGAAPRGVSVLTGVPIQYRDLLRGRGFHVIADRKGIEGPEAAEAEKLLALYDRMKSGTSADVCASGKAGDLDCDSVDLLAHFAFADVSASPTAANDIWGFVDLNTGREYAIAGYNIGIAVIDVTNPEKPVEVGFVDGKRTTWRDIKVYQQFDTATRRWRAWAYVTTDGSSDGLFVIDLNDLPHAIRKTDYISDFFAAHNVYITNTDYRTGIPLGRTQSTLVIAGSNLNAGRYRAYSLSDPAKPEFMAGASSNDYMHDASSIVVSDSRKDTQCVHASEECDVLLDFNETTIDLWDVTDPARPARLSRTSYANASYVHSGWWAEDREHIFVHDELDEQQRGLQTTLRIFSIADLASPVQVGTWTGPTQAIDHNGFVRGNRYYMSNYSRGLTILDITDPEAPVAVGRLDTYPFSDSTAYVGAWGAYPWFSDNTIGVNDIDSGLYLARDRSIEVPQGQLAFAAPSTGADEGQMAELHVRRSGGTAGAVSVSVELLHATTSAEDVGTVTQTLDWADGDGAERMIFIPLQNDGLAEGLERFFVRLVDPRGGATLGSVNIADVWASDPGATSEIRFFSDSIEVAERGFATAVAVLQRTGSALGAASVDWSIDGGTATPGNDYDGPSSGTVNWADGDAEPRNLEFPVTDDGTGEDTEFFDLSLSNANGAELAGNPVLRINIADGRGSNAAPDAIAGSNQVRSAGSQVTLDGSQSSDADGDALAFAWTQTGGPEVALTGTDTAIARFAAPQVDFDTLLQFELTVSDPSGLSDSSTVTVTITANAATSNSGSGGGAADLWLIAFLMMAALRSLAVRERYSKGCRLMMVCSRSGPVEMMSSGTPASSSMRSR